MANKKKNANIKDVAALTGVSIATVSRYLNGNLKHMSKATAQRIKDAIDKLGYIPNSAARQMVTKSSQMIAVMVSNIDDYFSTELFKGISSILESKGYIGVLFDSNTDEKRERKLLTTVSGRQMFDGLIIQPLNDPVNIQQNLNQEIPMVVVDRKIDSSPWPQVVTNNFESAQNATKYFLNHGFTHVVVLTSEIKKAWTRKERYDGIISVASNVDVVEIDEESYNYSAVSKKIQNLLVKSEEPTIIFSLKERWLLEFLPMLINKGIIDNKKVTATGYSDTGIVKRFDSQLKLIFQNPYLVGASSAEIMLKQLNGDEKQDKDRVIVIPTRFE